MRSTALKCVRTAEQEKGRPPYITEVAQVMKRDSYFPVPSPQVVMLVVQDLIRNDEVLTDREGHAVSLNSVHQRNE